MTDQSLEHSPVAPEQHTSLPATPAQLQEDTPWSPPLGPDMHKHKMCSDMVEAFSGGDTERASMLARLLLQHRASTFRVYAHLILAYGIDHGLSHARQAVEEAELAIKTHGNDHDQVAKLFGLAQRTLASIESQEPAMEKLRQAEESSDGVERVKKLIKEHTQKVEQGQEQHSSQESVKPNHAAWNFKQQK